MKRICVALVMLIVSGFVCGCEIFTVKGNAESYTKELEKISILMNEESFNEAEKLSKEVLAGWKETAKHLDKYLYHDYVDNITEEMATLPILLKDKDKSAVDAQIAEIKIQLASLKESELPYMHNIL